MRGAGLFQRPSLRLGLLTALLLGTFLGCGTARSADPSRPIQLTFWTAALSPTYDDYIQGLIEGFGAAHPEVQLTWLDLPQDASRRKLMAGIAAGDPPQLVNLDTEFALVLAQQGALVDVSELVTTEERERYYPNLWQATEYQGGVFAVPWYVSTRVIMAHGGLLAEAGLDPEHLPTTWEQLDEQARQVSKLTRAVGMMPPIRIVNDWSVEGAPVVDPQTLQPLFTDPRSVAVLQRFCDLYQDGTMPPETLTEGYRGALDRYKAGRLAFLEAGPQFLLRIKAEAPSVYAQTRLAPLPPSRTGEIPAATMNFAIPRSAKHRDWALKLALYLSSPEAQLEFCKRVPILPSTQATASDPYFQQPGEDPLMAEAVKISLAQLPRARDFSLALPRQKDLTRTLNSSVEEAIRGEMTAAAALAEAAEAWEKILAPFRPREVGAQVRP